MRAADARARLAGALLRAHQRFSINALAALHPDLPPDRLAAAIAEEQLIDRTYVRDMLARADQAATAAAAQADDAAADHVLRSAAHRERGYMQQHLKSAGRRMRIQAKLAQMQALGQRDGYWHGGRRPNSCAACRAMGGKVWPLTVLLAIGPHTRHHGCNCDILTVQEATDRGLALERGTTAIAEPDPPWRDGLLDLTEADTQLLDAIDGTIGGLSADYGLSAGAAKRLGIALREATIPRWRESDRPRWPKGHPLGGQWRPKLTATVPKSLNRPLRDLSAAAERGDLDGVEAAHQDMLTRARKLDGEDRENGLLAAHQAYAAVFNPTGANVPMGARIDVGDGIKRPIPLPLPAESAYGPWTARGSFMWELRPGDLGAGHDQVLADLARRRTFDVDIDDDGNARVETRLTVSRPLANQAARQLELILPQLRAMRVSDPGVDLADPRPLDIDPDEADEAALRDSGRSSYPMVSSEQLGDAAESVIDAVAHRLAELGVVEDGGDRDWLAGENRKGPLDWRIGDLGIEVKAIAMRSVIPSSLHRSANIEASEQAEKIAFTDTNGLRAALAIAFTDLDQDRVHVFLHEYDPDRPFTGIRPPKDLVDQLLAGELVPGVEHVTTNSASNRRHLFVGTFRLGFNPLGARPGAERDADASRQRARPADVGAGRPVPAVVLPETASERTSARSELAARDQTIVDRLTGPDPPSQGQLARDLGLTKGRISQIVKQLRADGQLPEKAPADPHVRIPASGLPARTAQEREARSHEAAGLSVKQIAKKMGVTQQWVKILLDDDAQQGELAVRVRDAQIVAMAANPDVTQADIARKFGLSPGRVSQILKRSRA